jgi:hypothetical protein
MLSRRTSKRAASSRRRSLNLATRQQPFRASMAQTVETEPRDIHPVPPQPVSLFPSPPGNSGHTRHDTLETLYSPAIEEHDLPQSSIAMPVPTPSVSKTPEPPASPLRPRQPAPGSGAGGFAIPSPHRESSHDYFRYSSTDDTPFFDPKFSPRSDPGSPPYETAGVPEGIHGGIWAAYNRVSQEVDEKKLTRWNEDLDVLLIFVSLAVEGDR